MCGPHGMGCPSAFGVWASGSQSPAPRAQQKGAVPFWAFVLRTRSAGLVFGVSHAVFIPPHTVFVYATTVGASCNLFGITMPTAALQALRQGRAWPVQASSGSRLPGPSLDWQLDSSPGVDIDRTPLDAIWWVRREACVPQVPVAAVSQVLVRMIVDSRSRICLNCIYICNATSCIACLVSA